MFGPIELELKNFKKSPDFLKSMLHMLTYYNMFLNQKCMSGAEAIIQGVGCLSYMRPNRGLIFGIIYSPPMPTRSDS